MNNQQTAAAAKSKVSLSQRDRIRTISKISILAAIAFVLMMLEFPLPLMPAFLKFDFSDLPALLAAFSMGPLAGTAVELIKNVLHLPFTQTMMVGELANFIIGSSLVVSAGLVYRYRKTLLGAALGMLAGTAAMTVAGSLFNYYVNIPFYLNVMNFPMEAIIGMAKAAGNHKVTDLGSLILWVFVPFNIFKGVVISALTGIVYKPLSPLLHK